jgi:hypothetical protein
MVTSNFGTVHSILAPRYQEVGNAYVIAYVIRRVTDLQTVPLLRNVQFALSMGCTGLPNCLSLPVT